MSNPSAAQDIVLETWQQRKSDTSIVMFVRLLNFVHTRITVPYYVNHVSLTLRLVEKNIGSEGNAKVGEVITSVSGRCNTLFCVREPEKIKSSWSQVPAHKSLKSPYSTWKNMQILRICSVEIKTRCICCAIAIQ